MLPEIKKILYATDLSENSRASLSWAMAIARKQNASLLMLNVIEERVSTSPSVQIYFTDKEWKDLQARLDTEAVDIMKKRMEEFCNEVQSEIPDCPYVADETIVRRGNPVEQIISTAKDHHCDIIVMGTTGAGRIAGAIMGSTARRVLRRSKVPVFVIPMKDK